MKIILTIGTQELKRFDLPEMMINRKMTPAERHEAQQKYIQIHLNHIQKAYSQLFNKSGVKVWISFESKMNHHYDKAE